MNCISDLHALGNILTDFVSNKDLKRKQDGEFISPSPKKPRTVHSLDYSAFLARVKTFTDISWCHSSCSSTSSPLSPLQLARHGWTAVEDEGRLARCISCRENLYLLLPSVTSTTFPSTLVKQGDRVVAGHAEFCPWGASPSPHSWALVASNNKEVVEMARGLVMCGTDLPWVKDGVFETFRGGIEWVVGEMKKGQSKKQEKRGRRKSKEFELKVTKKVKETAAALAVLGWQKGGVEDTMTDMFMVRRVGLWNFVSLQEEMDRVDDMRVARELSGQSDHREEKEVKDKKYFDPLKEHLSWNPLVVQDESGVVGWEVVRDKFEGGKEGGEDSVGCRQSEDEGKCLPDAEGEGETNSDGSDNTPQVALQMVRGLLDLW